MNASSSHLDTQLRQALALHQAGRLAEAEASYRQVLALRPDLAEIQDNCALAQLDRDDSPWYPGMRLFRQRTRGDWASVFVQMQQQLARLMAAAR